MSHLRFHGHHAQTHSPFGNDGFGKRAEGFARFFGTPRFIIIQTIVVIIWIMANAAVIVATTRTRSSF